MGLLLFGSDICKCCLQYDTYNDVYSKDDVGLWNLSDDLQWEYYAG